MEDAIIRVVVFAMGFFMVLGSYIFAFQAIESQRAAMVSVAFCAIASIFGMAFCVWSMLGFQDMP
jgi:hypothetical protein